jgi:hypothetical protein
MLGEAHGEGAPLTVDDPPSAIDQVLPGAGMRNGFAAIFGLAAPQATNGPTDIFFARIGPGRGKGPRR